MCYLSSTPFLAERLFSFGMVERLAKSKTKLAQMTQKQFVEGISSDIRKEIRASADPDVIDAWELIRLQDVLEKDSQVFKDFLSAIVGANIITKKEAKNFWQ